jgi:hypothetical protein
VCLRACMYTNQRTSSHADSLLHDCSGLPAAVAALIFAALLIQPRGLDDCIVDLIHPLLLRQRCGLGLRGEVGACEL